LALSVVKLRKGRARPFWHGNPVVFSGAVDSLDGDPAVGDLVEVRDHLDRVIGRGFFNPLSSYRVRMVTLSRDKEGPADVGELVHRRLAGAVATRRSLGLPCGDTDAYRLVNSEGDFLSGLTVDVYKSAVVVIASALWVEVHRDVVERAIREALDPEVQVIHRVANSVRREEGLGPAPAAGLDGPVSVLERGLRFEVDPAAGQKTGHYLDQRENRTLVRGLARDRRVFDAFCFTGGFAMNAAAGDATEVLAVDSSKKAVEAGRRNATANGLKRVRFEEADALETLEASSREWDMVVCDPPKLAMGRRGRDAALRRYHRINRAAMSALAPGGFLVTCSCSSAVRRVDFMGVVRDAATEAERRIAVTHVTGAAPDHVLNPAFPEGEYLQCVVGVLD